MGLATFGAGIGQGYLGATQGIRDAKADQMRDVQDDLTRQTTAATLDALPAQTALTKAKISSATQDLADKEELRQPQMDLTKATTAFQVQDAIHKTAIQAMSAPGDAAEIQEKVLGQIGEVAQGGDPVMLGAAMDQAVRTPLLPNLNNLPKISTASVIPAQPGMVDNAGAPITGSAIELTHVDGTKTYLNAAPMAQAYAKRKALIDKATQFTLKPGETKFDSAGKVLATGTERAYGGLVQDADGNWVDMRPRTAGAGSGSGKGSGTGKPGKDEAIAAVDGIWKDTDAKPTPDQKSQAYAMAQRALESGVVKDAASAGRVGVDIALHPEKANNVTIDGVTGAVVKYYADPEITGGRKITVSSNAMKLDDYAKTVDRSTMANAANAMLGSAVSGLPAEQQDAARAAWVANANDPKKSADFIAYAESKGGPAAKQAAINKLDLIRKFGPKPGAGAATAADPAAPVKTSFTERVKGVGGLMPKSGTYTPPAGSPAAAAADRRSKADAAAADRAAVQTEADRMTSSQFQKDVETMKPLELVQKYDTLRSKLSPADAKTLAAVQDQAFKK